MHDIYYAHDVFPWAGFDKAFTTTGAITHQDRLKPEWSAVFGGSYEQLMSAIEKLNPMRYLEENVTNYLTTNTTNVFLQLIIYAKAAKIKSYDI